MDYKKKCLCCGGMYPVEKFGPGSLCRNCELEEAEGYEDDESNLIPFMTPEQEEVQEVIRVQALQNQVLEYELDKQKQIYETKAKLQSSYFHDLIEQGFNREEALQLVMTTFLGGAE